MNNGDYAVAVTVRPDKIKAKEKDYEFLSKLALAYETELKEGKLDDMRDILSEMEVHFRMSRSLPFEMNKLYRFERIDNETIRIYTSGGPCIVPSKYFMKMSFS